jgi:hypothetical protein
MREMIRGILSPEEREDRFPCLGDGAMLDLRAGGVKERGVLGHVRALELGDMSPHSKRH